MPESSAASDGSGRIRAGDVSGTMVVGDHNTVNTLRITAESGSSVTVHGGPLPDPVKRPSISQLPRAAVEPLHGRERDVHALRAAIDARQLVQVWGGPGVGKSALLRHLARTAAPGSEGVAYVEAGGRTADDLAQAIFDISFDAPNYKPSREVLKEHLKTLRLRIYLDDVGIDERDLRQLVDMVEQSTFVFTARERSGAAGVHAVELRGLTSSAAEELVRALVPRALRPDEAPVVAALRDAVDGNPLRLRRIALSAVTGKGLPGIADLPELLPALLNKVRPQERDLLYLLGSLSGAELAPLHLDGLLGRSDSGELADGLVRHGLLLASETGYGCPPDVAECVLGIRRTEFPADRLCQVLTAWVEAKDTTPDDVAAHFQALDAAVLRAERSGHARLGVALARSASPKLALSRQFDAWGSLLGAGWAAARSAGDTEGEEFFLREARARKRAIGRIAQAAVLGVEAGVLMQELVSLHAHAVGAQAAVTMPAALTGTSTTAVHTVGTSSAVHTAGTSAVTAHVPTAAHAVRPVYDLSSSAASSNTAAHAANAGTATHAANTGAAAQAPPSIDFSHLATPSHTANAATPAAHTAHVTTQSAGAGHSALTVGGAASAKGGVSAMVLACAFGAAAVLGVGTMSYLNDRPSPPPGIVADPIGSRDSSGSLNSSNASGSSNSSEEDSGTVDPVCASVIPDIDSEIGTFNTDTDLASSAIDSYNTAVASYNSGATSTPPSESMFLSETGTVAVDAGALVTTLEGAVDEAQDSSVSSDLDDMLTAAQDVKSEYESFGGDQGSSSIDTTSQVTDLNSAWHTLQADCGE